MNKPTSILQTDKYQFTMSYAYLMLNRGAERTGFESFVRKIKKNITQDKFYIFNAEKEVIEFMKKITSEINEPDFFDKYWKYIENDVDVTTYEKAKKEFQKILKEDIDYSVMKNETKIYPKVPVFQFNGPKFIGQMIETPITNIINGRVGIYSYKNKKRIKEKVENNNKIVNSYKVKIRNRAKEYRNATSKILLEAGYRRAPSFNIAKFASKTAINSGWNGTSNTSLFGEIDNEKIGGTMAHSFIMSFVENGETNEIKAFKAWNDIFGKSTLLIDTYDTVEAIKSLIKHNIKPYAVRIDSDPIEELAKSVREIMDSANWKDVKIFLSGDITPEKLIKWEKENIPFDICMAGTKYVNLDEAENINPGFVYKVVEFERDNGVIEYPEKKAIGKSNYPGLKVIEVDSNGNINMTVSREGDFGFYNTDNISNNAVVNFAGPETIITAEREVDFNNIEDILNYFLEVAYINYRELNPIIIESYFELYKGRPMSKEELIKIKISFNDEIDHLNLIFEHISVYMFNLTSEKDKKSFIEFFKNKYDYYSELFKDCYAESRIDFEKFKKEKFKMFKLNIVKEII